jgi:hypothetical protein
MNIKTSHKIKYRLRKKDRFYTPRELAKELITLVPFKNDDFLFDPCLGKGAFFDNYPIENKKDFCEIDLDKDFFEFEGKVDWCISNPPYSLLDNWFKKTCEISRKGFAYLLGWNNLTAKRIEFCNKEPFSFGLTTIHMFKVFEWYGMSCFVIFEKNKPNIISYNRKVWREDRIKAIKEFKTLENF